MVKTTKLNTMPCIVADDILAFAPNSGLKNYANTISGSFTYPRGETPCSILINAGKDVFSYACHAWLGFPEAVVYRYKDGKFGAGKFKNTTEIPNRADVLWAVGGMGLLNLYNPAEEGFSRFVKNGVTYDYSDVLRLTNHTVLGIKDNMCYLVYVANMTGLQINNYCKAVGFETALLLDGGGIAAINGSEAYAKINTSLRQGYALQGINNAKFNPVAPEPPKVETGNIYYTVQRGDTLSGIAKKYNTTYQEIAALNGIKAPLYSIFSGQKLLVKKNVEEIVVEKPVSTKKPTVIIDAGHNELTSGKRAFDGSLLEHEFNLDVANRIKKHLDRHGVDSSVLRIVDANATNELNTRVGRINTLMPDIVVSIHANAYGTSWNTANGWEIYCYKMTGDSLKLAQMIYKHSIPYLGMRDRGIKDGSAFALIGKINRAKTTSVLIEHGFYTNKDDLIKLKNDAFREMCAVADAKGILEYFGIAWQEPDDYVYEVQIGVYGSESVANDMVKKLNEAGFYSKVIKKKRGEIL